MSVADTFAVLVTIVTVAFVAGALGLTLTYFNTAIQSADVDQQAKDVAESVSTQWPGAMDWIFVALAIGLPIVSMGLAYFIDTPPFFFYTIIGYLFMLVFAGWGLQSGYQDAVSTGGEFMLYITNNMPVTDWVLSNMGIYTMFIVLLIGAGTYIKRRGGYGYASEY